MKYVSSIWNRKRWYVWHRKSHTSHCAFSSKNLAAVAPRSETNPKWMRSRGSHSACRSRTRSTTARRSCEPRTRTRRIHSLTKPAKSSIRVVPSFIHPRAQAPSDDRKDRIERLLLWRLSRAIKVSMFHIRAALVRVEHLYCENEWHIVGQARRRGGRIEKCALSFLSVSMLQLVVCSLCPDQRIECHGNSHGELSTCTFTISINSPMRSQQGIMFY